MQIFNQQMLFDFYVLNSNDEEWAEAQINFNAFFLHSLLHSYYVCYIITK